MVRPHEKLRNASKHSGWVPLSCWIQMVDLIGIEPMTSSMPWKRAPSCATGPHSGGSSILEEPEPYVNLSGNLSPISRCLKKIE